MEIIHCPSCSDKLHQMFPKGAGEAKDFYRCLKCGAVWTVKLVQ